MKLNHALRVLLLLAMAASRGWGQPTTHPTAATRPADNQIIRFDHLVIDRRSGKLILDAEVVQADYNLEFLLCEEGGKEYESVLRTPVRPWQVHAGLLLLGLSPGIPAEVVGDTYIPPRGAKLDIELEWTDKTGKRRRAKATDWLAPRTESKTRMPETWVFLGSDLLPDGSYWADVNSGIIAVANLDAAVIDVPFESTQTIDRRRYVVDTQSLPEPGTPVRMTITPLPGSEKAPYARALLEIDSRFRMRIDGRAIRFDQLREWAEQFTTRHSKAQVVIRSAPRSLACFSPLARTELKIGGVFDFRQETAPLIGEVLPLTDKQVQVDLDKWAHRLAHPEDRIEDPGDEARRLLRQIERRQGELRRRLDLWDRYKTELRKQVDLYNE